MNTASSIFMVIGATAFLLFIALPLLISPMRWGRRIGWKIPDDTDLANYLGRSLGGLLLPVVILLYIGARDPWEYRVMFDLVILATLFAAGVHFYGFLRRRQPVIEHVEILMYIGLTLIAWYFYPQPPV